MSCGTPSLVEGKANSALAHGNYFWIKEEGPPPPPP